MWVWREWNWFPAFWGGVPVASSNHSSRQIRTVAGRSFKESQTIIRSVPIRASENFWGCLPQSPPKNLGQIPAALAISGIFERFSPGQNGPEVGGPVRLFKVIWRPTSEPFWPGENLSDWPQIAKAVRIWPKLFSDDCCRQTPKFSLALLFTSSRGPGTGNEIKV